MSSQKPTLSVQINQIDHTLVQPGFLDDSSLHRVPIVRIYGASSIGKKTCVHVHQVYPYFFVEYTGKMTPDIVNRYIVRLAKSLNHALAISLKRNLHGSKARFVRGILLVKGVHFYGFHSSYSPFLKILMIDPAMVNRAATIMQSGTIMQTRFRVFESHLGFILQFLCDFGLYGCGWLDLDEVWQRGREDVNSDEEDNNLQFKPSQYFRESRMTLEVDVPSHQILNRHLLSARNTHYKLCVPAPPTSNDPLVLSVRELWEDERSRRVANGLSPSPELPLDQSESSRGIGGGWDAETMWWDRLRARIEKETTHDIAPKESGESWEGWVMTTFESVEALWDERWKVWRPSAGNGPAKRGKENGLEENPFGTAAGSLSPLKFEDATENDVDVEIDETVLLSSEMDQFEERDETNWDKFEDRNASDEDANEDVLHEGELSEQNDGAAGYMPSLSQNREVNNPSGTPLGTPNATPNRRPNPFEDAWLKITGRASSRISSTPTPEKLFRRARSVSLILPPNPVTKLNSLESKESINQAQPEELSSSLPLGQCPPDPAQSPTFHSERSIQSPPAGSQHGQTPSSSPFGPAASSPFVPIPAFPSPAIQPPECRTFVYATAPPSTSELQATMLNYGIPDKIYRDPYYSNETDVPERSREFAGLVYNLKGGGLKYLEQWHGGSIDRISRTLPAKYHPSHIYGWEYASSPPSMREVKKWLLSDDGKRQDASRSSKEQSQIKGPTQKNIYGLKGSPAVGPGACRPRQDLSILSLEIFAPARGNLAPDPGVDGIVAAFYAFQGFHGDKIYDTKYLIGKVFVDSKQLNHRRLRDQGSEIVLDELELLNRVADIVLDLDPDIIIGWDVQHTSWGYLNARGLYYGLELGDLLSRAPQRLARIGHDQWGERQSSTFKVVGRHVFNLWRIMRHEQTLDMYTFENVVFHVLRQRVPHYSTSTLTKWFHSTSPLHTSRVIHYFTDRISVVLDILEASETVTKTAEFARVFGVDFFSVLTRGSQFKVESFMFRIAKPESFVLLSPSKQDVGKQNAAECMPLIMEPLSAFYNSPLLVLDFQSLYPSVMIAYNYCYSTCLGRIADFNGRYKFGVTDFCPPHGMLDTLQDHITVAPNGIMYTKPDVRKGLLGRMLTELLQTRVMVKQAMKDVKGDKALMQILDARQLGLKFICNVTYGYTSATYSGRMPAVEIADSIVQTGRETLEKAVRFINSCEKWEAKVVYGDTDSLFVYLRGRTKAQAFKIGQEIAETITALNPSPIKLKFEKVYLPCVLMAKKRYVGFKYENATERKPTFDAKGIETVRRDGVPAQQKMVENCLKILFRTQDLSEVKSYCWSSWMRILENKAPVQDFIFAKEVRMGSYSDKLPPPPGVAVAAKRMIEDQSDGPQYGERVPYVIARGKPGLRLVDRAVDPREFLDNSQLHLDGAYYISRVLIPPLSRIFNLVGADVRSWYEEMPKTIKADQPEPTLLSPTKDATKLNRIKIDEHFQNSRCFNCGAPTSDRICYDCRINPQLAISGLLNRMRVLEQRLLASHQTCVSCTACEFNEPIECDSLDCPWMFERKRTEDKVETIGMLEECINELSSGTPTACTSPSSSAITLEYADDPFVVDDEE